MKYRKAESADADAIAKLHLDSWRKNYSINLSKDYLEKVAQKERFELWHQRFRNPKNNQRVFLAEENNLIVGFACLYLDDHQKWGSFLDNLHVAGNHQGKGIGASLLRHVFECCRSEAPTKGLCLLVNQTNVKAQKFYLSNGASETEPGYWDAPDGSSVPTFWFTWTPRAWGM